MKNHLKQRPWHKASVEGHHLNLHYVDALKSEPVLQVPYYQYCTVLSVLLDIVEHIESEREKLIKRLMIAKLVAIQPGEQLVITLDGLNLVIELA